MVIRTPEDIDYTPEDIDFSTFPESDGQPMAETTANVIQMVDLLGELKALFSLQGRGPVTVGGNQFVYYNPANGRDNISPDIYVVFGVAVLTPAKMAHLGRGQVPRHRVRDHLTLHAGARPERGSARQAPSLRGVRGARVLHL